MKALMFAAATLFLASAALADTAAPAAGETIAPPACHRPVVKVKVRKADDDGDFNEASEAYKECINKYVQGQNDLARAHTDAANAAVETFNAFLKEVEDKKSGP